MRIIPKRRGFITMVEAIVVMGLLGFLVAGLALAVARVREARDRIESANNLKMLGLAVHNANASHNILPPAVGRFPSAAAQPISPHQSIFFHLLPYLEQHKLYLQGTKKDPAWNRVIATPIKTFISPQDPKPPANNLYKTWLATTNYAANSQLFGFKPGGSAHVARIPDGSSNTIIFTERYQMCNGHPNGWAYDGIYYWTPMFSYYSKGKFQQRPKAADCDPKLPQGLGSDYITVGLGDGSVRTVMDTISPYTWQLASDPADGMVLPEDF